MFAVLLSAAGVAGTLAVTALGGGETPADPADEAPPGSPLTVPGSERDAAPDSCDAVSASLIGRLAPGAARARTDEADPAGRQSACTWARFGPVRGRQLSVELRAVPPGPGGGAAAVAADRILRAESRADRAGQGQAKSPWAHYQQTVPGLGDAGYATYVVDGDGNGRVGVARVNVRVINMLVTVTYSGANGGDTFTSGAPLSREDAVAGGVAVARDVVTRLAGPRN